MNRKPKSIWLVITIVVSFIAWCGVRVALFLLTVYIPWRPDFSHDTGEVLNIYCRNDEFRICMTEHYPGYKDNRDGTGRIGDVKVNWIMDSAYNMNYQDRLDTVLERQDYKDADQRADIFLVEADYAPKYTNAEGVCVSMKELGLTRYMSDQYQYTKDVVTDDRGRVNGASPVANPGLYAYRRSAAREVFGTDDPEKIQKYFSDWDKFAESAEKLSDEGWKILAGYDDAYRVYAQNVSDPWVVKGGLRVDDSLMDWVEQTKELTDRGYNNQAYQWSEEWFDGMTSSGDVFGYFGPSWFIDYSLARGSLDDFWGEPEVGNGTWGDWAVMEGPAPYFWGGYWICVAQGSDNTGLAADIIYQLTCNEDVMEDMITAEELPFCNNRRVMKRLAKEGEPNEFLGGQNALPLYCACADDIRIEHGTAYDWDVEQCFRDAMSGYFDDKVDINTAIYSFHYEVERLYPELVNGKLRNIKKRR